MDPFFLYVLSDDKKGRAIKIVRQINTSKHVKKVFNSFACRKTVKGD